MEKKSEYTEIDRLKDELVVAQTKLLYMQLRAARNEVGFVEATIKLNSPVAEAAEKRLIESGVKTNGSK